ncbi:hypothetical protein Acj133p061 [Acinetobacter phage 133]|uniref:Uncharacterized protein n=1 Tax=Acinetobacter phage 133 TaxID=2919552 RepID=D9I627_9CAUD|nr:hypothetical protein Acj133p061 [Acinetobacter phage 133]ADJ19408.1 hypothetical protein Acj133p061 [Acinetobacter phage 133]
MNQLAIDMAEAQSEHEYEIRTNQEAQAALESDPMYLLLRARKDIQLAMKVLRSSEDKVDQMAYMELSMVPCKLKGLINSHQYFKALSIKPRIQGELTNV